MRRAIGRGLLLIALLLSHDAFAARPLRVLFVGNSLTQTIPAAQQSLSRASTALAREIGVDIADVGAAMQRVPGGRTLPLLHKDGHPAPIGIWLAATALVQTIGAKPLPSKAPPRSCGSRWQGHLKAGAPASAQRRGKPECHAITPAQSRPLRAAVLQ